MAKFEKSKREIVDVEEEIKKLTKSEKKSSKKVETVTPVIESKIKKTKAKTKKEPSKDKTKDKSKKEPKKSKIVGFFKDVKKEMSKVQFPSRKEMTKYSVATIIFILFFGILFYSVDLIIAALKAWV